MDGRTSESVGSGPLKASAKGELLGLLLLTLLSALLVSWGIRHLLRLPEFDESLIPESLQWWVDSFVQFVLILWWVWVSLAGAMMVGSLLAAMWRVWYTDGRK